MSEQVEITSFDLRYEGCRMKNKAAEKALLCSISENGIRDPLQGVDCAGRRILLNGFKRYRCARKLQISLVPYRSLGSDEVLGVVELLRIANARSLGIIEQAKLIDELKKAHHMSSADIARLLEKSQAWVSVRAGLISEIPPVVMRRILQGQFPVYSYMYCLRPFIRLKGVSKKDVSKFVESVAGKGHSIRDIEILAQGYFKGSDEMRRQIENGNTCWGLSRLKDAVQNNSGAGLTQSERRMLQDIEIAAKYISRVRCKVTDSKSTKNNAFHAQAGLLCGGILRQADDFIKAIRQLYDRSREAQSHISSA